MARKYQLNDSDGKEPAAPEALPEKNEHHLAILEALADGVNPFSGENLPHESIYQHAKVLRALQSGVAALRKQNEKQAKRAKLPAQAGNPWTEEEEERLLNAFDDGATPKQLAKAHGRTLGAIQSRLTKKGRI